MPGLVPTEQDRFWAITTLRCFLSTPGTWVAAGEACQSRICSTLVAALTVATHEKWPHIVVRQLVTSTAYAALLCAAFDDCWPTAVEDVYRACQVVPAGERVAGHPSLSGSGSERALLEFLAALPEQAARLASLLSRDQVQSIGTIRRLFPAAVRPLAQRGLFWGDEERRRGVGRVDGLLKSALDCIRCWTACDVGISRGGGAGFIQEELVEPTWASLHVLSDDGRAGGNGEEGPRGDDLLTLVLRVWSSSAAALGDADGDDDDDDDAIFHSASEVLTEALQAPSPHGNATDTVNTAALQRHAHAVLRIFEVVVQHGRAILRTLPQVSSPPPLVRRRINRSTATPGMSQRGCRGLCAVLCVLLERHGHVLWGGGWYNAVLPRSHREAAARGGLELLLDCTWHPDLEYVASPTLEFWVVCIRRLAPSLPPSFSHTAFGSSSSSSSSDSDSEAWTVDMLRAALPFVVGAVITQCSIPDEVTVEAWAKARYPPTIETRRYSRHHRAGGQEGVCGGNNDDTSRESQKVETTLDGLLRFRAAAADVLRDLSRDSMDRHEAYQGEEGGGGKGVGSVPAMVFAALEVGTPPYPLPDDDPQTLDSSESSSPQQQSVRGLEAILFCVGALVEPALDWHSSTTPMFFRGGLKGGGRGGEREENAGGGSSTSCFSRACAETADVRYPPTMPRLPPQSQLQPQNQTCARLLPATVTRAGTGGGGEGGTGGGDGQPHGRSSFQSAKLANASAMAAQRSALKGGEDEGGAGGRGRMTMLTGAIGDLRADRFRWAVSEMASCVANHGVSCPPLLVCAFCDLATEATPFLILEDEMGGLATMQVLVHTACVLPITCHAASIALAKLASKIAADFDAADGNDEDWGTITCYHVPYCTILYYTALYRNILPRLR